MITNYNKVTSLHSVSSIFPLLLESITVVFMRFSGFRKEAENMKTLASRINTVILTVTSHNVHYGFIIDSSLKKWFVRVLKVNLLKCAVKPQNRFYGSNKKKLTCSSEISSKANCAGKFREISRYQGQAHYLEIRSDWLGPTGARL